MSALLDRVLCRIGWHGPDAYGEHGENRRSLRTAGFERTCMVCGARWEGRQVFGPTVRYVGDWQRVN